MWRKLGESISAAVRDCFKPQPPRRKPRLRFQTMEPRLLLSADLMPAEGVLDILGTDGDDVLLLRELDGKLEVDLNGRRLEYDLEGIYTLRIDLGEGDNQAVIRFGDGEHGARPPSGTNNIRAEYRSGLGDDRVTVAWSVDPDASVVLDELYLSTGGGNDAVALLLPAVQAAREAARVHIDGGDGIDALSVDASAAEAPTQAFFKSVGGLSSETEVIEYRLGMDGLIANVGALERVALRTGAGDDRVFVDIGNDGPADIVAGAGPGGGSHVKAFDGATLAEEQSFFAYGTSFQGGVRVATGDVNGDGITDIITGAGAGAGPHVKVFDGASGAELASFFAFDADFRGGVYVAAGDINGDGRDDLVVGAGAGGHVKVFDGATLAELQSFFAYGTGFSGGVRVAVGDVNGDGQADIITGVGAGFPAHVKAFDGRSLAQLSSFFAFDPGFTGGVYVAAGDVNGDGRDDIVVGADAGAAPHVKVFSGASGAELASFFAYDPAFSGGVRVAAGDVNGDGFADLVTGAGPGGAPHVKVFDLRSGTEIHSFFAYGASFQGGVYVAAGDVDGDGARRPGMLDLAIDTGAGDDTVKMNVHAVWLTTGHFEVHAGTGSDKVEVRYTLFQPDGTPVRAREIDLGIHLGGADAGAPESGDEVLVAFEHGDPRAPVIIGALWNSQDAPGKRGDPKSLHIAMREVGDAVDWSGTLVGGAREDTVLIAGPIDMVINGRAGDDVIQGGDGDDLLIGGPGDDTLIGGEGNDRAIGGPGRDVFQGVEWVVPAELRRKSGSEPQTLFAR